MSDNPSGSESIQDRIAAAISEQPLEVETTPEVEAEAPEVEAVEAEVIEVEAEAETETEDAEVEPHEDEEVPQFETVDDLAEALGMEVGDFLQNIRGKFKLNGEESEITLAELQAGYQKDADYRHKTAELAEQRKADQEAREKANAEMQARLDQLDTSIDTLNNQLLSEFSAVNWDDLRMNDPGEYAARLQEFQGRQVQINQAQESAKAEREKLAQEQQAKQAEAYQSYLQQEQQALLQAIPTWSNPDVAKAEQGQLTEFLRGVGFNEQEISAAADHRIIKMAYDLMNLKKKVGKVDVAKNIVKSKPKLVKPGAKVDSATAKAQQLRDQKRAIKKGDTNALRSYLLSKV